MIDGFKLKVSDSAIIQKLFNSPKLDFKSEVSHATGEVSNIYSALYKGLRFQYINYPNKQLIFIQGSLPQYYTGLSNYTNLPLTRAWEGLRALIKDLGLNMYSTEVLKLEWGVNVCLPQEVPVNRLIQNILVYKGKTPSRHVYERNGVMYEIDLNDFSIKIYNKSAQQPSAEHWHTNVMRYEIKVQRKPLLHRMGMYSLNDFI